MEGSSVRHHFKREPPNDHPSQVWLNLVQRWKFSIYDGQQTDGQRTSSDGNRSGELKVSTLHLWVPPQFSSAYM